MSPLDLFAKANSQRRKRKRPLREQLDLFWEENAPSVIAPFITW
jgi:hypothetical protein